MTQGCRANLIKFRYHNETWPWQSGFPLWDKVFNVAGELLAGVGESEVGNILARRGDGLAAGGGRGHVLARCEGGVRHVLDGGHAELLPHYVRRRVPNIGVPDLVPACGGRGA